MTRYTLVSIGVLGLTLLVAETLRAMPAGPAALGLALFGAALAPMISGAPTPLAVGLGAIAALAWAWLRPVAPIAAGAVVAAMIYASRALRSRDVAAVITHLAIAAIGGASATWVLARFGDGDAWVRVIAITTAMLLVSLPFALHAEDARVSALVSLARRSRGPARWRLLRAAALQRRAIENAFPLARDERRRIERALRTVHRLGEARADAGVADLVAIDRALGAHVAGIARLMRALRARWACGEAIDGGDARELDAARERAAAEAAALEELA
ncbi:hypothetical protein [Sandaracinus amylolyticus]|uniref:hypothetical protein n=1 Tax=Sandaracinus amylolyticus TaxID=927083 RepID=UPI00069EE03B|nr:hypothetical protein [Sandaracinus amylolyticus]